MKFQVVRLGLTCACMNYSTCISHLLEGSEGIPPTKKFGISGLLKFSLMRFLSINYIVGSCCSLERLGSDALKLLIAITISAETHSLHGATRVTTVECRIRSDKHKKNLPI